MATTIVCGAKNPPRHRLGWCQSRVKFGFLRQVLDCGAGLSEATPRSGCTSPAAMRNKVDLPEPLRPTNKTRSPARDGQLRAGKDGRNPKGDTDVLQEKQRGAALLRKYHGRPPPLGVVSVCQIRGPPSGRFG